MSSSTSSSERPAADAPAWRGFVNRTLLMLVGVPVALLALLVALDPYDTGRMGLVHTPGALVKGDRIGHVSRLHDEGFDAALFGNSHILTLSTARLSAATGLRFVTLAIPGTGPLEQMTVLDAYLARHSPSKGLVIAVDITFCTDDLRQTPPQPFPDWLYDPSRFAYLAGLFQMRSLEMLAKRVAFLAGRFRPQNRDGTMDIFEGHHRDAAEARSVILSLPREGYPEGSQATLPAFGMLAARLDRLPPTTPVVLLLPPVAAAWLPEPGSQAAASVQACKARAAALTTNRPNVRLVDWHKATPETADFGNFWDATHYYEALARLVEQDVAQAFADLGVHTQ